MIIFQGTFDPFTNGHLEIVKQAHALFGQVRILLLVNPDKKPLFSIEERKKMISAATASIAQVSVDSYEGLLVDYMRAHGLTICVRGVRNAQDCVYELHNAHLSQALYPDLCTLFLPCSYTAKEISSSAVKTLCQTGHLPNNWVSPQIHRRLTEKFPLS